MVDGIYGGASRTRLFGPSIFGEITALAHEHGAVNLGQGFPDFEPPTFVLAAASQAVADGASQQYARGPGHPELVQALVDELSPTMDRRLDPMSEITITTGATEGLFASIMALVEPGDEVVLIEPFYDAYPADVALAGGICRYVPLQPDGAGGWGLDPDELRAAFSARTRLLLLNTPHNPTGKVFTEEDMDLLAELCKEHDALVLSDEVYDRLLFDGREHFRMASLPGMWERTVTLGSAGKTFSVTGWKVGWAVAPPHLSQAIRQVHQWIPYSVATPLQRAVAAALRMAPAEGYYAWLTDMYQQKRDRLVQILRAAGMTPHVPEGTYFITADTSGMGEFEDDLAFCRHLTTEVGVAAIPPGAFYCDEHRHLARRLARFGFCKTDDTLEEAAARLGVAGIGEQSDG